MYTDRLKEVEVRVKALENKVSTLINVGVSEDDGTLCITEDYFHDLLDTIAEQEKEIQYLKGRKPLRKSIPKFSLFRDADIVALFVNGVRLKDLYKHYDKTTVLRALRAKTESDRKRLMYIYRSFPDRFYGVSIESFKIWLDIMKEVV